MNSIDETFVGSIYEDIIKNNIKNFVKLVDQGVMTKEEARNSVAGVCWSGY